MSSPYRMLRTLTLASAVASAGILSACAAAMAPPPPMQPPPPMRPPMDHAGMTGPMVHTTDPMSIRPAGPPPAWAPGIDPQMLAVIEQLDAFEQPPLTELTGFQARNTKSPTGAVMALLMKTGMPPTPPMVDIAHRVVPGPTPQGVLVRTYTPSGGNRPLPVIVYYHGGGWVIADLDTYEASAMALAAKTGAIVVSVAYRQAPENPFPAAHEDAFAAYRWVTANASQLGGDPSRIATAGESAGGNLSVAVALMARERGVTLPVHILSVYPIADGDTRSPSCDQYANAKPLSRPLMQWFFQNYLSRPADANTAWISLVDVAELAGLPPTTIINAEIDPLRSEGEELAMRMRQAGVSVEQRTFMGVTHEFFGMGAVLEQAVQAQDMAAMRLRQAFRM
ncbi:MAG: alpha/beta hydrolase [Gemmatimonadota bacterium]|nr:alpha/beta hydrolase [Gemmatimonadota bacterium]